MQFVLLTAGGKWGFDIVQFANRLRYDRSSFSEHRKPSDELIEYACPQEAWDSIT
jgi:hypothetical protein